MFLIHRLYKAVVDRGRYNTCKSFTSGVHDKHFTMVSPIDHKFGQNKIPSPCNAAWLMS